MVNRKIENQKYREQVKENCLKGIEEHKKDIRKLKDILKRLEEGKHPYYKSRRALSAERRKNNAMPRL